MQCIINGTLLVEKHAENIVTETKPHKQKRYKNLNMLG